MSAQENTAVMRAFNEAFNARDWDRLTSLCTPDVEHVNVPTGETFHGPDGIRRSLQSWATAFPNSRAETTQVFADEQRAALEFRGMGTHTGPLIGPAGTLPPTGRYAEVRFCVVAELRDGKVARSRQYFDLASLLQQLGALPQQEMARV